MLSIRPRQVCTWTAFVCGILTLPCPRASAQTPLNLNVSTEAAALGSSVQFKIFTSAPALIASGAFTLDLDPAVFGPISDLTVFSSTGDAIGYARVSDRHAEVHFSSPSAGIGQLPGLPVAVFSAPTIGDANVVVTIDASLAKWLDPAGKPYTVTVTPRRFRPGPGGTISIQSVTPGGGYLPAGAILRVTGAGFDPQTTATIDGVSIASQRVVDPEHLELTLGGATEMTGKHLTIANSAGEREDFFSAIPSAPAPSMSQYPGVFPLVPLTLTQHTTGNSTIPSNSGVQNGLALMNQTLDPVTVTFLGVPYFGTSYSQVSVTVPPSTTYFLLLNTLSNGQVPPFSTSRYYITASTPIRMLSFYFKAGGPLDSVGFNAPAETTDSPPPISIQYVQDPLPWSWQTGTPAPAATTLGVLSPLPFTAVSDVPWIRPSRSDQGLVLTPNLTGLAPGTYSGNVTLTPVLPDNVTGFQVQSTTVHVSLSVSAAPFVVSPYCCVFLSFGPSSPPGNSAPVTVTSNGDPAPFTVATSGEPWFTVDLDHGTTPATLHVSTTASVTSLAPGDYKGSISVRGPNNTFTLSVTLTAIGAPPPSGQLHVVPSSMQFVLEAGTPGPLSSQSINSIGNGPVTFTARTLSGGDWLKTQAIGNSLLTLNATAVNLGPGIYTAEIVASAAGFTSVTIPVTLTVLAPPPPATLRVSRSSVNLSGPAGVEQTATINVDSASGTLLFQAIPSGATGLIYATVQSAYTSIDAKYTTPATVTIHATATQPGTYRAALTFQATNNSITVPITFDVSAGATRPPQISAIVNAASGLPTAFAPGEIISIFGLGVGAPPDISPTSLLINGTPANVIYASSGQVNAVVPDDAPASGVAKAKLTVGTTSSSEWGVPFAAAAPGIFTLDGSGTGPAAVLNQDNSVNTPANPAAHGSVIQIFATGIPNADQPIKVAIGGFDATIQYQGPAPGLISGVQQINVIVPSQAPPIADLSLVIRINGLISTTAATIAVR